MLQLEIKPEMIVGSGSDIWILKLPYWFTARSYALAPVYEAATRLIEESPNISTAKVESDDVDSKEVIHPGVNLLFDGSELRPFDIGACLQARQPVSLITEASAASSAIK